MIRFDKESETPLDDISGLKIKDISTRNIGSSSGG